MARVAPVETCPQCGATVTAHKSLAAESRPILRCGDSRARSAARFGRGLSIRSTRRCAKIPPPVGVTHCAKIIRLTRKARATKASQAAAVARTKKKHAQKATR
jgi:hypothetical protein